MYEFTLSITKKESPPLGDVFGLPASLLHITGSSPDLELLAAAMMAIAQQVNEWENQRRRMAERDERELLMNPDNLYAKVSAAQADKRR